MVDVVMVLIRVHIRGSGRLVSDIGNCMDTVSGNDWCDIGTVVISGDDRLVSIIANGNDDVSWVGGVFDGPLICAVGGLVSCYQQQAQTLLLLPSPHSSSTMCAFIETMVPICADVYWTLCLYVHGSVMKLWLERPFKQL